MSLTFWTVIRFSLECSIRELRTLTNSSETSVDYNINALNDKRQIVDSWQGLYFFKNHISHSRKKILEKTLNTIDFKVADRRVTLLRFPGFTILSAFCQKEKLCLDATGVPRNPENAQA